ncbi:hypothetical protein B0T16DRAFT_410460 [Cercophora newfieldiana]|uniref:Uncharacterized protein n=1 Tax=Cercophora newfieldiana TaxID=92897 RepID=A0AA40CSI0_9PEZI|nr:hypothetical protein B0T16DRAFT_410460 [Cercophora newfieldiana]
MALALRHLITAAAVNVSVNVNVTCVTEGHFFLGREGVIVGLGDQWFGLVLSRFVLFLFLIYWLFVALRWRSGNLFLSWQTCPSGHPGSAVTAGIITTVMTTCLLRRNAVIRPEELV